MTSFAFPQAERKQNSTLFKIYRFAIILSLWMLIVAFAPPCSATEELIIEPEMGRAPLIKVMRQAESSIDLVMYGFTDKTLLLEFIKTHQMGKKVRVLIEPHPFKADDENLEVISELTKGSIPVQLANPSFKLTHQKSFVIDHKKSVISTFNLTRSAFKKERNFALVTDETSIAKEMTEVMNADWNRQPIQPHHPALIWSPGTKILAFIDSAKASIEMYAQELTDYKTIEALAKASREGVSVKILLSGSEYRHPFKKIRFLKRAGIEIHFSEDLIIHAKVIIVDHNRALLGSTNFTYPSMHFNRELSVISKDRKVIRQLDGVFSKDFGNSSPT